MEQVKPDLAKKLGIKPGMLVCLLDVPPEAEGAVRASAPGAVFSTGLGEGRYDAILFWPRQIDGLVERFAELQGRIVLDGAIWAIIPKQKYAGQRGVHLTWEQVQAAGLQTDLVDNKVASINEQDYGTRFVIRKERRIPLTK